MITGKQIQKIFRTLMSSVLGIAFIITVGIPYQAQALSPPAPQPSFLILRPTVITRGQSVTVTWKTIPGNAAQYPYEKIEYCAIRNRTKCTILATSVLNKNEKATVFIPLSLPLGLGEWRFTARNSNGELLHEVSTTTYVKVVKAED